MAHSSEEYISDEELNAMGMSREMWDRLREEEERYVISWAHSVNRNNL
jgi:hypothetical protein